jgi:hypothetical protein
VSYFAVSVALGRCDTKHSVPEQNISSGTECARQSREDRGKVLMINANCPDGSSVHRQKDSVTEAQGRQSRKPVATLKTYTHLNDARRVGTKPPRRESDYTCMSITRRDTLCPVVLSGFLDNPDTLSISIASLRNSIARRGAA